MVEANEKLDLCRYEASHVTCKYDVCVCVCVCVGGWGRKRRSGVGGKKEVLRKEETEEQIYTRPFKRVDNVGR